MMCFRLLVKGRLKLNDETLTRLNDALIDSDKLLGPFNHWSAAFHSSSTTRYPVAAYDDVL